MTKQELDSLEVEAFRALQKTPHLRPLLQNLCQDLEQHSVKNGYIGAQRCPCGDGRAKGAA
jgi:hypothetical protein